MPLVIPLLALLGATCQDNPAWDNHSGKTCADYHTNRWCTGGWLAPGSEWTGGPQFNWPERACCACGKQGAASAGAAAAPEAPLASAQVVEPDDAPAEEPVPAELAESLKARMSMCTVHAAPRPADRSLLYFVRLPRTGNALGCRLLSACSAKQSRAPCGTAMSAADAAFTRSSTCPASAASFTFAGNEKLSASHYACASGNNASATACLSFDGDVGAACTHLGTIQTPAAVMIASERLPDFPATPPCPVLQPAVRLLALLRDPGERAQSAFQFHLENCVCAFKSQWCTMFTSFRFRNRQSKLCDEHTPKHGFASAIATLRAHGNMPWPVTSSETSHVLGRYTAGVVREVYAPYFGGYRSSPSGSWRASSLLARKTLMNCFAWVGIVEELPISLRLLKKELPAFFTNLDIGQFAWTPASANQPMELAANQSQHPYLRSHLLTKDYEIYDAEKRRLLRRARRAGFAIYKSNTW